MRYIILMIVLGISLIASEIHFEHDFNKALQQAKNQDKKVMMMYTAQWCPECNYMKDVVLKKEEVVEYIQKHYIVLTLDIQKDNLPKGFDYIGIPTFFIIDKDGKETNRIIGGSKADKFLKTLKGIE